VAKSVGKVSVNSLNVQPNRDEEDVPHLASRFRQASKAASSVVAAVGLVVLCGWAFKLPSLTLIWPTFASMKVNSAVLFVCLGAALWMAGDEERHRDS
jgi:protein-S-isoprenylcysteine O-methyltransferase Ste14